MKNSYIIIAVIVVIAVLAFVFGSKEDKLVEKEIVIDAEGASTVLADGTYKIDINKSNISWTGEYVSGATEEGVIELKSGSFMVASGQPFMGTFDIDVLSLKVDSNLFLQNYLKGKEFLDVDNYPIATFAIGKVLPNPVSGTTTGKYIIEGKLTLKDKTNSVSFPATFYQVGNVVHVKSSFAINRTEWNLVANKELRNAVFVNLHIEATK